MVCEAYIPSRQCGHGCFNAPHMGQFSIGICMSVLQHYISGVPVPLSSMTAIRVCSDGVEAHLPA
jgi:hypothetical protein